jgi:hypothetical protein
LNVASVSGFLYMLSVADVDTLDVSLFGIA